MMGKILVIGSLNMDMVINVDHMPKEGETILSDTMTLVPGGKGANQACAAGRLGADTVMIGAVGKDSYGEMQLENLSHSNVDVTGIIKKDTSTGTAFITVNKEGNNSIVVIPGANASLCPEDIENKKALIAECDILILQLEIPMKTVLYAAKLGKMLGKTVILDPAPVPNEFPEELYRYIDIIKPNETELFMLTKRTDGNFHEAVSGLKKKGIKNVLVTLGEKGVYYDAADGENGTIQGHAVKAIDTTAAGDSFTAALAVMLMEGRSVREAAEFANRVSAIVVTRKGAQSSIPTLEEVSTYFSS